jgi:hypothetical protein
MNLVARNLVIASILAATAASATIASALPIRNPTDPIDAPDTAPRTKGQTAEGDLGTTPVLLRAKFQEPNAATKAVQLRGAVAQDQSLVGGPEELEELGELDDAPEPHASYGVLNAVYPTAKFFQPLDGSLIPAVDPVAPPVTAIPFTGAVLNNGNIFTGTLSTIEAMPSVCSGTPVPTYSKTWSLGGDFGNSKFGAGYEASFTLASTASATPNMDRLSGEGVARAFATIFGNHKDVAKVAAKVALQGTNGTSSASIRVLGTDIWSRSVAGNLSESKTFNKTFFSASQLIWLGPVPVTFKGTANGTLGYDYAATYVAPNVNLTAKPFAKAYSTATAAIDVGFASAGVTGSLRPH